MKDRASEAFLFGTPGPEHDGLAITIEHEPGVCSAGWLDVSSNRPPGTVILKDTDGRRVIECPVRWRPGWPK